MRNETPRETKTALLLHDAPNYDDIKEVVAEIATDSAPKLDLETVEVEDVTTENGETRMTISGEPR